MIKTFLAVLAVFVSMSTLCAADVWQMDLSAGSTNVTGGLHYKTFMDTGYLRVGGTGVLTDDDATEYKLGSLDIFVGSDTIRPGLNVDIGLRGILGDAEEPGVSGDIGAVAFSSNVGYLFSRDVAPIPIELFGGLTWAPEPLSFSETETYFEAGLGVGLRIIKNASIIARYSYYRVDMESGPGDWRLTDNIFHAGLMLQF